MVSGPGVDTRFNGKLDRQHTRWHRNAMPSSHDRPFRVHDGTDAFIGLERLDN